MKFLEYDLDSYVNRNKSFLLKEIIICCIQNSQNQLLECLLKFIDDKKLINTDESFFIKFAPFKEFTRINNPELYREYLGYYLEKA